MPDLAWYRSLKELKKFGGKHAKFVGLMEDNIVKKAYHQEHREIFDHEVYCIKRLQEETFIPKLLMVDDEKRTIYMTYCGKPVKNIAKYQNKINKYQKKLQEVYGIHHNDVREGNVCIDTKGQIYLIDFGWSREYEGVGGYGKGKIGNTQTQIPVTKKELLDFLKDIYYADSKNLNEIKSDIQKFFIRDNDPLPKLIKKSLINKNKIENKEIKIENKEIKIENKEIKIENKEIEEIKESFDKNKIENKEIEEIKESFDKNKIENKEIKETFEEFNKEIKEIKETFEEFNKEIKEIKESFDKNKIENKEIKEPFEEFRIENKEIKKTFDDVGENNDINKDVSLSLGESVGEIAGEDLDMVEIDRSHVVDPDQGNEIMEQVDTIEVMDVTTFRIQRQGNPYLWSQI
jgi:uncharacterized coiled-coil DUF342 family protein